MKRLQAGQYRELHPAIDTRSFGLKRDGIGVLNEGAFGLSLFVGCGLERVKDHASTPDGART